MYGSTKLCLNEVCLLNFHFPLIKEFKTFVIYLFLNILLRSCVEIQSVHCWIYTDLDKIIGTPGIFVSSLTLALNFSLPKPNVFQISFSWIVPLLVCNIACVQDCSCTYCASSLL